MNVVWEKVHPYVLGAAAPVAAYYLFKERPLPVLQPLFAMTLDLGAIAIGFLGTAKGILLSIDSSKVIQEMRALGSYERLTTYIINAVRCAFILAGSSFLGVLVDSSIPKDDVQTRLMMFSAWIGIVTAVAFSSYQVVDTFFDALKSKSRATKQQTATA
ncbi:hypothetical protein [Myxococcus virescens]|uniref:Uncharacterized protein n=1 Tax=Myxococcus virescens TaxID=83456 RepID=A0A511HI84_9BACT|nr:hypothetical protein [Myxococcus virescens]GEL73195.1 hypothetical protein MVI01_49790 [Myxococcus virescens]SDD64188.1 hypothetical protein SAMN04488504_10287 [Myxococcus virescens]